jgi:hypothetical protein
VHIAVGGCPQSKPLSALGERQGYRIAAALLLREIRNVSLAISEAFLNLISRVVHISTGPMTY